MPDARTDPTPIADLHCDLLSFLAADPARTPDDPRARCSLPQLREGGVGLQVLAAFTRTVPGSVDSGRRQVDLFRHLLGERADEVVGLRDSGPLDPPTDARIRVIFAIENASGFCEEHEPVETGLERLRDYARDAGPVLYCSLTWNDENRFGGGNQSRAGLHDDGRRLLDTLVELGIAVDFSHTSDALAEDILTRIEQHGLPLRVLASHSNFRALQDTPRNLPDDLAREIARRGGVQGLNFMAPFLGPADPRNLARHADYGANLLGAERVALGADFFCSDDLPPEIRTRLERGGFFEGFETAACYPRAVQMLRDGGAPAGAVADVCWHNAVRFVDGVRGVRT